MAVSNHSLKLKLMKLVNGEDWLHGEVAWVSSHDTVRDICAKYLPPLGLNQQYKALYRTRALDAHQVCGLLDGYRSDDAIVLHVGLQKFTEEFDNALRESIRHEREEVVQQLLEEDKQVIRSWHWEEAMQMKNKFVLHCLVHNATDSESGLCMAVKKGLQLHVRTLIEAKAPVNCTDSRQYSPLHIAASLNNKDMFKMLLQLRADPLLRTYADTPLHSVVVRGREDMLRLLVDNNSDADQLKKELSRALHTAGSKFCYSLIMVKQLLEARADVNGKQDGNTLLQRAVLAGNSELASCLLAGGADPDAVDKASLLYEVSKRDMMPQLRQLLDSKADVNIQNPQDGARPLHGAVLSDAKDVAACLLEARADINVEHSQKSLLYLAAEMGSEKVLPVLLEHGAVAPESFSGSPLQVAMQRNRTGIMKALVEKRPLAHQAMQAALQSQYHPAVIRFLNSCMEASSCECKE
ncbi:unnamed protein product [Effrenium voratum]|uniref:Uncharacterized protein n=1 Tax=Effrenium voratum TaxID=2562239 RepID=A0AA36IDA1_9DINO|nr:unnamed protein product [Effrenium voratum]CAJ1436501.1 unnamed protein product [Effrenium voratum]